MYFTEQCLCSVAAAIKQMHAEVWVVDNASTDDSLSYLQPRFPWVHWIASNENLGFAKANNLALKKATGQYVLFLNPDTIIPEHCLSECAHFMASHPDAGAIGVHMIDGSGVFLPESKRALPSPAVSFWKLTGISALFPTSVFFNRYALGHLPQEKNYPVPVLSGAYMFCRADIIVGVGGFDEQFFMYGEDIDLSYRITQAGYQNYYLGSMSIVHFKGESTPGKDIRYVKLFYKAMQQFVQKHYTGGAAGILKIVLNIAIAVRAVIAACMLLFRHMTLQVQRENKKYAGANNNSFILVGDALTREQAHQILASNKKSITQESGDLSTSFKEESSVVFCTGILSYSTCISFCRHHAHRFTYYWHGAFAASITGSPFKNQPGIVYIHKNNY